MLNGEFEEYIDCEVKTIWNTSYWNQSIKTIHISCRREKSMKERYSIFMTNDTSTHALILPAKIILESPRIEVKNKYVNEGELFFDVPFHKAKFVIIPDNYNEKCKLNRRK